MSTEKKLVFVVEDNPHQQQILKVHFEEILGAYQVKPFISPDELMLHLDEKPFAIVLDHIFDGHSKTGLDYLVELRKKYKKLPVIYHTTYDDESVKKKVMELGAEAFILKDGASMVRLRTALDNLQEKAKRKGLFRRLVPMWITWL